MSGNVSWDTPGGPYNLRVGPPMGKHPRISPPEKLEWYFLISCFA